LLLDEVIWSDSSDFRQLFLADQVPLNGRLAAFYGAELPPEADFQSVSLDAGNRSGLLTHPYVLANFAYTATSSPIHRGVFLARSVMGRSLRPPPIAVAPLAPDLHPDSTTRERVTMQTSPEACQTCHTLINPLGFTLEGFDAAGRFREQEKGKLIDDTGTYVSVNGQTINFDGARSLAQFVADSDEVRTAFVEQLFQYLVKQPVMAYGPETLARLSQAFADSSCQVRRLLVEIAVRSALGGESA
jgi:hypothetical protein